MGIGKGKGQIDGDRLELGERNATFPRVELYTLVNVINVTPIR